VLGDLVLGAMTFIVIGVAIDLLLALTVMQQAAQRGANVIGWGLFVLALPFVGYAIWRSSINWDEQGGRENYPSEFRALVEGRQKH
jgi:hypothetical protein